MRVVIAGGGTGGHVYPGIALANALAAIADVEVHWVGTADRMEATAVPKAGIPFHAMKVAFLKGRTGASRARALATLPVAGAQSVALLRRLRPAAVIGVGGFASGPIGAAGAALNIPLFLLEQNATPGFTNRVLSQVATVVYASFPNPEAAFAPPTTGRSARAWGMLARRRGPTFHVFGNPIRQSLLEGATDRSSAASGGVHVFVLGGSQGARSLNEATPALIAQLRAAGRDVRVRHAAGLGADAAVRERYIEAGVADARVDAYIEDMAGAYAAADLVITRAGATTIAELTATGTPAMFVPFPFAADDHQTANALAVVERGGGVMVTDDEYRSGDRAARILTPLLGHPEVLRRMAAASRALGRPDAGAEIAAHLLETIGGTR